MERGRGAGVRGDARSGERVFVRVRVSGRVFVRVRVRVRVGRCLRLGEVLLQGPEDEADRGEEEVGQRALEGRDRVARLVLKQLAIVKLDVGAVAAEDRTLPECVVGEVDLVRVRVS